MFDPVLDTLEEEDDPNLAKKMRHRLEMRRRKWLSEAMKRDRESTTKKRLDETPNAVKKAARAKRIIDVFLKSEEITNKVLAKRAGVNVTVVYALKRGEKRFGGTDVLDRIASQIGCPSDDLWPPTPTGNSS